MSQSILLPCSGTAHTQWHSALKAPTTGKAHYTDASALKKHEPITLRKHVTLASNAPAAAFIVYQAKRGAVHVALNDIVKIFSSGMMPPQEALYQFFSACARSRDTGSAMKVYKLLIDRMALQDLPLSKRSSKSLTYIFSIMINLLERNIRPVDFNAIWSIYEDMQKLKIPLNTVLYNNLLKILLNRQDHAQVHSLYREMLHNGQKPSLRTYSMLMLSMAKQGDISGFTKLLDVMQSRNMFPDFIGWCVIMNALGRLGNLDGVEKIYEYLRSSGVPITSRIVNERLNAVLLRPRTQRWTRARRLQRIKDIWEEEFGAPYLSSSHNGYPLIKPDAVSYTIIMKALSFDAPEVAMKEIPILWNVMDERGLVPGSEALIHYVSACLKCRRTFEAKEAIVRFKEKYNILANERTWRRMLGALACEKDVMGISWALDALTGSTYVHHNSTVDYSIPRKRPSRYRNNIKQDIPMLLPPTTFLNNVFGPKTLPLVFNALLKTDTQATGNSQLDHQSSDLVITAWNRLLSAGVYIPLKIEQSIIIPGLLAKGIQMQDIRQRTLGN